MLPVTGFLSVNGFIEVDGNITQIAFSVSNENIQQATEQIKVYMNSVKLNTACKYDVIVKGNIHFLGETININEHFSNVEKGSIFRKAKEQAIKQVNETSKIECPTCQEEQKN